MIGFNSEFLCNRLINIEAETVAEVSQIGNGINLSVHCSSFYFFFTHKCRDNVHFIACEQKVGLLQPVSR